MVLPRLLVFLVVKALDHPYSLACHSNKYFMRICGMTTTENILLNPTTFFYDACGIMKVILMLAAIYVLQYILAKHVLFL